MVTAADTLARAEKLMRAAAGAIEARPAALLLGVPGSLLRVWVCAVMALLLARNSFRARPRD